MTNLMTAPSRAEVVDLFWRSFWTAVQTGTAVIGANGVGFIDASLLDTAGVSAIGAALSVVKSFAGNQLDIDAAELTPTTQE